MKHSRRLGARSFDAARAAAFASATLLVAALGTTNGCKERKALKVDSLQNAAVGELVRFEGTLALRGSQPFPALVLELDDGSVVRVESKTIQKELESLTSLPVSVEGEVLPPIDKVHAINAVRYRMLRLPSGELPVVGVVTVVGDNTILTEPNGTTHWIRGSLVPIIRDYKGARVWIVGATGDETAPGEPRGAKSYWVTGYGVLAEAE